MDVSSAGYPLYLRDLVEITRGYEDPSNVMNFRTIKVPRWRSFGKPVRRFEGVVSGEARCRTITSCRPAARSRSRFGR